MHWRMLSWTLSSTELTRTPKELHGCPLLSLEGDAPVWRGEVTAAVAAAQRSNNGGGGGSSSSAEELAIAAWCAVVLHVAVNRNFRDEAVQPVNLLLRIKLPDTAAFPVLLSIPDFLKLGVGALRAQLRGLLSDGRDGIAGSTATAAFPAQYDYGITITGASEAVEYPAEPCRVLFSASRDQLSADPTTIRAELHTRSAGAVDVIGPLLDVYRGVAAGVAAAEADAFVASLPLVSAEAMAQFAAWNASTAAQFDTDGLCLHQLFERQAALRPDARALSSPYVMSPPSCSCTATASTSRTASSTPGPTRWPGGCRRPGCSWRTAWC